MKTKHLDNEIERLNLMERTKDLSEYGQGMLNEFRAIKQALTIPVVVDRIEQLVCNNPVNKCPCYMQDKNGEKGCKGCKHYY